MNAERMNRRRMNPAWGLFLGLYQTGTTLSAVSFPMELLLRYNMGGLVVSVYCSERIKAFRFFYEYSE